MGGWGGGKGEWGGGLTAGALTTGDAFEHPLHDIDLRLALALHCGEELQHLRTRSPQDLPELLPSRREYPDLKIERGGQLAVGVLAVGVGRGAARCCGV